MTFIKKHKELLLISFLVIFHTVGLFGMHSAEKDEFLKLSFMNLVISFVILLLARKNHSVKFYLFILFLFLIGMSVEWIGIHTGFLFGDYAYGENLGLKIYDVPLIIGINWAVLTICSCSIAQYFKLPVLIKAIFSAALMTGLDFVIEPVAIVSDYWSWNGEIPIFNYICWFVISFFVHLVYYKFNLAEKNKVAVALYIILVLFFILLIF